MSIQIKRSTRLMTGILLVAAMALTAWWSVINRWHPRQSRQQVLVLLLQEARRQGEQKGIWMAPKNGIGPPMADYAAILKLPAFIELKQIIATNPHDWIGLLREQQNKDEAHALYAINALLVMYDPEHKNTRRGILDRLLHPSPADSWRPW